MRIGRSELYEVSFQIGDRGVNLRDEGEDAVERGRCERLSETFRCRRNIVSSSPCRNRENDYVRQERSAIHRKQAITQL